MSTHTLSPGDREIEERFARMLTTAQKRSKEIADFIAAQPAAIACQSHPHVMRQITLDATRDASFGNALTAGYDPCQLCQAERNERLVQERLHKQGVPAVLLNATMDGFRTDDATAEHVATVKEFTRRRAGFLLFLGDVGTGKSHLAVGAMRDWRDAYFVKQGTLLRMLRDTYQDRKAVDPVELCQDTGLLVLDEIGITGGGRDEAPMLHEILDYRHGERKPTILTSNLDWTALALAIGPRLADRLKQSAFRILTFSGASQRSAERKKYFANLPSAPPASGQP